MGVPGVLARNNSPPVIFTLSSSPYTQGRMWTMSLLVSEISVHLKTNKQKKGLYSHHLASPKIDWVFCVQLTGYEFSEAHTQWKF